MPRKRYTEEQIIADQSLDIQALKAINSKNF